MLTPDRYEQITSIFARVRESAPGERESLLAELCGGDGELRREVESYLAADAGDDQSVLGAPVIENAALLASAFGVAADDCAPGSMIGQYRVVKKLGEGGFGNVYLADQLQPVQRQVALKVIKPGMDSKAVIARFEQERQALAVMDHANVARVFDAGTTMKGYPYFVMEYVDGEPITRFCDHHRNTIKQRLELFISVCEAVQHAHMKGIIHRDITPNNILVAMRDGRAVAKVIDFGIAKAIEQDERLMLTTAGQLIGTPEYMSPEQAERGASDIDTRTDVYSLGVVLYELLAGVLPFDSGTLRNAGADAIRRIIREEEPPKPSTKLSAVDAVTGAAIAAARQAERERLASDLRRELEWVPLKSLRKERAQRYQSPREMADDINRYLNGQPLAAGPESASYRARKYLRRHRTPIMIVGLTSLTLLLGTIAATQAIQAKVLIGAAKATTSFIDTDLFGIETSDGSGPGVSDVRLQTILDAADTRIGSRFAQQPELEVVIRSRLAKGYLVAGNPKSALKQVERVFELRPEMRESLEADAVALQSIRAESLFRERSAEVGIQEFQALYSRLLATRGEQDALTLEIGNQLGGLLKWSGHLDEAEQQYRTVASRRAVALGPTHVDTLITEYNIATVMEARALSVQRQPGADLARVGDLRRIAIAEMRAIAAKFAASVEPHLPAAIATRAELAMMLTRNKEYTEAEKVFRGVLPEMERSFGWSHWRTLSAKANFARTLMYVGAVRLPEARDVLAACHDGYRWVRGKSFGETVTVGTWLIQCQRLLGDELSAQRTKELILADLRSENSSADEIREAEKKMDRPFPPTAPSK